MPWLKALTEFGDLAVLMPLATVMLAWLLLTRSSRGAVWWVISVAVCAGLTAILKVSFYGCPPTPYLHSPSGHTSFSILAYGAMALVTASQTAGLRRIITIASTTGFVLAIAVSRLLLYIHSAAEIGLGVVIGAACLTAFGQGYLSRPSARRSLFPLFLVGAVVVLFLRGRGIDIERLLQAVAQFLSIRCA
jgi:membrane-associated phospholipid phosphatase